PCSGARCDGWPRSGGMRSFRLRIPNWLRFVISRQPRGATSAIKILSVEVSVASSRPTRLARNVFGERAGRMGPSPKGRGNREGINPLAFPPGPLVAAPMQLAMVTPADGDGEAIADL